MSSQQRDTRQISRQISRRSALKWLGFTSAAAYLAACAPPIAQIPTEMNGEMGVGGSQETKVISISHFGGGSLEASEESQRMKMLRANFPELEFENRWVSFSGYVEKIPLAIASNDLADLQVCNAFNDVPLMMENEMLAETDALLAEFGQNILTVTPPLAWDSTLYDGKQYAVAHNIYDLNTWSAQYRKDWLDKLGLGIPTTIDEYAEVLRAFAHDDPDGNGIDDTWGRLLYTTIRFDDDFFHAFGVAVGHHLNGFWRMRGNQLELDWVQPEMKDALVWLRDRWAEGDFHPDSISIPLGQKDNAFQAGLAGNVYTSWHGLDLNTTKVQAIHPNAEIVAGPAPEGPGGRGYTGEGWPWVYVIPKECPYAEDCVRVVDFFCTPEIGAQILCEGHLGVTNKGLNEQGWCVEFSREERLEMGEEWMRMQSEVQEVTTFFGLWMPMSWLGTTAPYPHMPEEMKAHFEEMLAKKYSAAALDAREIANNFVRITEKKRPVAADKEHWPDLQSRFGEFISQAVSGALDVDQGWDEWLAYFEDHGGLTITEEVNSL